MRYKLTSEPTMHSDSQGGMRLLEWTGSLVPQGVLVKGAPMALTATLGLGQPRQSRAVVNINLTPPNETLKKGACADDQCGRGADTSQLCQPTSLTRWRRALGAKTTWRTLWKTFMQELAPQSKDGEYARPSYDLRGRIGSPEFPVGRS